MTGALIGVGSGLVLGLALLIWALRERTKRHDAEMERESAFSKYKDAQSTADRLRIQLGVVRKDLEHSQGQIDVLRKTISGLHEKLAECKDPAAVEKLLNDELGEQL